MEHGGVPRQYAVWVWPNSVAEARPAEDTYLGDNPSARAAAYTGGNRTKPVPNHGPPRRPGEVAVAAPAEDVRRAGAGGTVRVVKVSRDESPLAGDEDARNGGGGGGGGRQVYSIADDEQKNFAAGVELITRMARGRVQEHHSPPTHSHMYPSISMPSLDAASQASLTTHHLY